MSKQKETRKELTRIYYNEGDSVKDIAGNLGVHERTIYNYLKEIRDEPKRIAQKKYETGVKDVMKLLKCQTKEDKEQKLKFLSTPSHGYLLVPTEIMDKYPVTKRSISDFSWITDDVWYLEEDADACLFMESTKYTKDDIEFVDTEDDIGLHIMSPHNPDWIVFYNIMCIRLDSFPCDAKTLKQSKFVMREFFPNIDIEKSIKYFKNHSGFCDCEVLYNVEDNSDNIKKEK